MAGVWVTREMEEARGTGGRKKRKGKNGLPGGRVALYQAQDTALENLGQDI